MSISVKLFDYNPISVKNSFEEPGKDANEFVIQCFALNKNHELAADPCLHRMLQMVFESLQVHLKFVQSYL